MCTENANTGNEFVGVQGMPRSRGCDAPIGVSQFCQFLAEQWNRNSRRSPVTKVQPGLLVAIGMLLTPQLQQKWRHLGKNHLRMVDFGMASRAERDQCLES